MTQIISGIQIFTGEEWIQNGRILIENGVIHEIGAAQKRENEISKADSFQSFETKNILAIPGFVNAHTHTGMMALRGFGDDMNFETWLFDHILPREDKLTESDVYYSTLFAQMEMARNGITTFADMYMHTEVVGRAISEFGMRASLCRGLVDQNGNGNRLEENIRAFEKWHLYDRGRIRVGFGPHAPYTCSKEYLREVGKVAQQNDTFIHIHVKESLKESDAYSLKDLAEQGILSDQTICAHCVHVNDEDIQIMAQKGVGVVHNPSSNLKLGNGIAPIQKMKGKGIVVGLGTDGVASNNSLDLWKEMYLCSLIHKGANQNPCLFSAEEVFRMATLDGHHVLGFPAVGILKKGYDADITFIDLDHIHYTPVSNLSSHLVYSGRSSDVVATMVQGKWIYYFGSYPQIDAQEVKRKMDGVFIRLQ